ncbi:MAG: cell division protein CrgA [Microcella sp.]
MARTTARDADNPNNARSGADAPNPVWFKPVMFGFMLLGLVWIITYYVSASALPIAAIGPWNIMVGFGIMFIGFLMTTRWR